MTQTDESERPEVSGQVKWFDPAKGFGFVVADTGGPDILLHANVLRNFGQSSVADGSQVMLMVQQTERGMQAVEIISIAPPRTPVSTVLADLAVLDPEELASRPLEPARVKWFDKGKGFGFANVFAMGDDVFIHVEVLRQSGLADLLPGEAVCLRVIEGKRGRMATEVLPWDTAVKELG
ncbi:cold-shock protein [Pseudoroseicyclus tamaricis]|uniref:Cold shock domain-containing protein n=1 Tax=Pseudoroseicyclus tamaricis TaxID=2705421 RepID=A0A6B2JRY9_9RHOB|nr:cold shock domain-containing protein [Pseudoroseicyclus tamaricis]NDV00968.1 cold shock domain-containing protein [Pseudoroseicyclus tamaricis]